MHIDKDHDDELVAKTALTSTHQDLCDRLEWLRNQRRQVSRMRNRWDDLKHNQTLKRDRLFRTKEESLEKLDSILRHRHSLNKSIERAERWNTMNDCFHIWHQGPFATINNCRLGAEAPQLPSENTNSSTSTTGQDNNNTNNSNVYTGKHANTTSTKNQAVSSRPPVEAPKVPWPEVNFALGHVTLLLKILSDRSGIDLPHALHPMGGSSKITVNGVENYLFFEESSLAIMPLWGRHNLRNFHLSLNALCECIYTLTKSQADKTIAIPHGMVYDKASNSWKVGGVPLVYGYGSNSGVDFTRACKYLLTNLKWMVAYSVKHHVKR